jgi:hypothetical protein
LLSSFNVLSEKIGSIPQTNVPRYTITTVIEPLSRSAIPKSSLLQCRPAMLKKNTGEFSACFTVQVAVGSK